MSIFGRKFSVLFVCTENICRSPLAEAVLRHHLKKAGLINRVRVDSAGTRTSQPGSRPDQRTRKVAAEAGVNLGQIRARRIIGKDFVRNDLILAMDHSNMNDIKKVCPALHQHKIELLMHCVPERDLDEVPDPYYGSYKGFEEVYQLVDAAVLSLILRISDVD